MLFRRATVKPPTEAGGGVELSPAQALAYSLPNAVLSFASLPLVVYLPAFYNETVGLSLLSVALCLFAARLFDLLSDPLIGHLSDRLTYGHDTHRRTLMVIGTPLMACGLYFLLNPGDGVGWLYLLGWSILSWAGWSLIAVPYLAWGAETGASSDARNRAPFYREAAGLVGIATGIILAAAAGVDDDPAAFLPLAALVLIATLPASVLLAVLFAPERAPGVTPGDAMRILPDRSQRTVLLAMVLSSTANALPASLFLFFVRDALQLGDYTGLFLVVYFVFGIASLPFWLKLSRRTGKLRSWRSAMLLASLAFAFVPVLVTFPVLALPGFVLICLLTGAAQVADLALPASLLADLNTGQDGRAGLAFGFWGFLTKFAGALGVLFAFGGLALAGYDRNETPDATALIALTLLYSIVPVGFKLLAIITLKTGRTTALALKEHTT